jgi:hypothetical protein
MSSTLLGACVMLRIVPVRAPRYFSATVYLNEGWSVTLSAGLCPW